MSKTACYTTVTRNETVFSVNTMHNIKGLLYFVRITAHLSKCIIGTVTLGNINLIEIRRHINNFRCFTNLTRFHIKCWFTNLNATAKSTKCSAKTGSNKGAFTVVLTIGRIRFIVFCH